MSAFRLDRLLEFLTGIELLMAMLWLGLAIFTVGLTILMYTHWGQYKPLRKCMAMSLLAHLLLAGYAATVEIVAPRMRPVEQVIHVTLGDGPDENADPGGSGSIDPSEEAQPWAIFPDKPVETVESATEPEETEQVCAEDAQMPDVPALEDVILPEATPLDPDAESSVAMANPFAPDTEPSMPERFGSGVSAELLGQIVSQPRTKTVSKMVEISIPNAYRLRVAPNRANVAQSRGGSAETETAVKAALGWLADNQSADGRWDPRKHGAGRTENILGRNRQNAGSRADTAMTGLALLAFLASGHTHLEGPYRDDVRRGLEFLVQTQAPDGNLGASALAFEFMYCHAMATCALSEAYGLTRDRRLREPVRRAIGYTIAAQDPKGGGWRYKPGDPGDTSQLGWQLMSLKSAELAGISMPNSTRQGIIRFLQSVSSGRHGGLASYRPGQRATRSMTAEALVCWQFLGLSRKHPACNEAADYLLGELPGEGIFNLYYWYYATLGTYQLQDHHWQQWNEALRAELVGRQIKTGPLAGSWDTDDLWGCHGGRVYTTALATLTLEVYYRFLPLYGGNVFIANRKK